MNKKDAFAIDTTRFLMELDVKQDGAGVDWKAVSETLKCADMAYHEPDVHRKAFEASHTTVFVYHVDRLIGFGRAISDVIFCISILLVFFRSIYQYLK